MNLELPLDHSVLVASKERLEAFLAEYETKVAQAKEQLHHIEALLNLSFASPTPPVRPALPATATAVRVAKVAETAEQIAPRTRRRRDTSLKFLPQYQGKTLTEAVLSIFQENRGKCLDADTISRLLYGELTGEQAALAKERVTKNLSKGKIDGLWQRVPNQVGYYTLSLADIKEDIASLNLPKKKRGGRTKKLLTADQPKVTRRTKSVKEAKVGAPRRQRNSLRNLKMRSPYQGSTMMDAISKVLKEREGEFVNADLVVKTLYGELPSDIFRIVKDRVTKSLSKGKIDGLWERVPEQTGYYTLSMAAVRA